MGLNADAKVQIHVGGIYHDKLSSLERFICNYALLDESILHRLVIENDERLYTAPDCLSVHKQTGIPVLLEIFHHSVHNTTGESVSDLLQCIGNTWKKEDGIPMVDYSSQHPDKRLGAHAECVDRRDFCQLLIDTGASDFDIMLEIKDKEKSALAALAIVRNDLHLVTGLS